MEFSQFNVNALMEITARPDLVFVRGQGSWLEDHAGSDTWTSSRAGPSTPWATAPRKCRRPCWTSPSC